VRVQPQFGLNSTVINPFKDTPTRSGDAGSPDAAVLGLVYTEQLHSQTCCIVGVATCMGMYPSTQTFCPSLA